MVLLNNGFNPDLSGVNQAGKARAVGWGTNTYAPKGNYAPTPTTSTGVGQWQFEVTEVNTVSAQYALPSGGTWVWVAFQTKGADSVMKIGGGIDAGGTILLGGNNWRIKTPFCTGTYKESGYYYQIIIIRYRIA